MLAAAGVKNFLFLAGSNQTLRVVTFKKEERERARFGARKLIPRGSISPPLSLLATPEPLLPKLKLKEIKDI